jgi:inner membrane protein involved in colicin E2 resistance
MLKRITAIGFIFLSTTLAWLILGTTVTNRTQRQDVKLKDAVGQLWGTVQRQKAPKVFYQTEIKTRVEKTKGSETISEYKTVRTKHYIPIDSSSIDVGLNLNHRRKGLLWYSTYRVDVSGKYRIANYTKESQEIFVEYEFPSQGAIYDDFHFILGGEEIQNIQITSGKIIKALDLEPGQTENVEISYSSQGMDEWWYEFGSNVNQVKNFSLTMHTDFEDIDFPQNSISPTEMEQTKEGWNLKWEYSNLLSGVQIGMDMPQKLNPGPWVSRITKSAPVSLFLFFFLIFVITTVRKVNIHPMNYFFVSAAFFSFHLLLAYLVDHVSIHISFLICSLVSIFLVVSYMRMVAGERFAFVEVGISQFVYLVLFSYTFFFERFTGLAITILCILTLFVIMQFTGRVDWEKLFHQIENKPDSPPDLQYR